jgi:integrase/recombinase XerD
MDQQTLIGDIVAEIGPTPTVRLAIKAYETVGMPARNLSARTRVEYLKDLRDLATFLEQRGVVKLDQASLRHLESYQVEMDTRGYKPATRRRKTLTIRSFFNFLHAQRLLADNYASRLIPPRIPRSEPRFLSKSEYQALLAAARHSPRDGAIIEVFLQTGMRLSECARLTLDDLIELPARPTPDPDNVGLVRIRRKGAGEQTIPLNYKACRAIQTWLKVRPDVDHRALWISKFGKPLGAQSLRRAVKKYLIEAGIDAASVHTLRHTMATHHIAAGTDLKTLQETLGHADLATTAIYVSLAKKAQNRALQEHAL